MRDTGDRYGPIEWDQQNCGFLITSKPHMWGHTGPMGLLQRLQDSNIVESDVTKNMVCSQQ